MYKYYLENLGVDWKFCIRLGERGVVLVINKDYVDERLYIFVVSDIFVLR